MTEADVDTLREMIAEDTVFTHMSGRQQNREEYLADIENGSLRYFSIGMENSVVEVDGDPAEPDTPAGTKGSPVVYMTTDISSEGLMAAYEAPGWEPDGKVAVKLSTGEPPASNYLDPNLIKDVVHLVDGTIVECNTAYGGSRASTAAHYQVAEDHGFTAIADVVILDENGSLSLPVEGGTHLTENYVGEHFADYDSYLVLSHFKGHAMAGFGGAGRCCWSLPRGRY